MPRYGMMMVCFLLMVFLAVSLSAQTGGAMLYSNGDVKVDGQPAGYSTSVYSGDKVDVTAASAGSINRNGSSVVVSPNSSIQYDPSSIQLLEGTARISTSKGMSAQAGDVVVSPQNSAAKFDVTRNGDKLTIASREGVLTVKDGNNTVTVQPGASTAVSLSGAGTAVSPSQTTQASLLPDRLSEHPFYGVVNGVDSSPETLPVCPNVTTCIRPSVSNVRPCCCPPVVQCH